MGQLVSLKANRVASVEAVLHEGPAEPLPWFVVYVVFILIRN